jgi:hypothetical protein
MRVNHPEIDSEGVSAHHISFLVFGDMLAGLAGTFWLDSYFL